MTAQSCHVPLFHAGAPLDLTTGSTLAALTSLSNLQCLWLSLSFTKGQPDAGWVWLQALHQLTSIHLSDHESIGARQSSSARIAVVTAIAMYQTAIALRNGHRLMGCLLCIGSEHLIFDFQALGHMTMLREAIIGCAVTIASHQPVSSHQHIFPCMEHPCTVMETQIA